MKKLLLIVLLIGMVFAYVPEKTYTFQAGELIRADRLNKNEDDFYNALTDGLADLTVGTVSCNTITSTTYNYTTTQLVTYSITPADTVPCTITYTFVNGGSAASTATTNIAALAPVHIPQGAILTNFLVSANTQCTVSLYQQTIDTTTVVTINTITGGTSTTNVTSTIDNGSYLYYIKIGFNNAGATRYYYYTKLQYSMNSFSGLN